MGSGLDSDIILKIVGIVSSSVGVIAALIALPKILVETSTVRKSQRREEYEFSKKFMTEVFTDQTMKELKVHPLIVEKGYEAITGKHLYSDEIIELLKFKSPSTALRRYYKSQHYIELKHNGRFEYIKKYSSKKWRTFLERWHLSMYWICSLISFLPFIFSFFFIKNFSILDIPVQIILFVLIFFIMGISELWEYINMECASYIMEEQDKLESIPPATEHTEQPKSLLGPDQEKIS